MLFLTFKRPFKNASANTISWWVKDVLRASGVDISIFSAHSTRHASTSNDYRKGIKLDVIRSTVGWSEKSQTFAKYYNRPIASHRNDTFARAVLSKN